MPPARTVPNLERLISWFALLVVAIYVLVHEVARCPIILDNGLGVGGLFIAWDVRSTPFLVLLILLPLAVRHSKPSRWFDKLLATSRIHDPSQVAVPNRSLDVLLCLVIACVSLMTSRSIADMRVDERGKQRFGDLPPAYHDEYSYLFQAQTFLSGRLANPSHPTAPEYFDQMHVLNDDGVFASRYFPGTGAWIAPFVAIGHPYWGHWLAGMLTAVITFWIGKELDGRLTGMIAGLGVALCPGIAVFGNLLLAHHPTMLGLAIFQLAFLRMMRTRTFRAGLAAGCGLSFAMLCRPMTAAGVGLPFGLWLLWSTFRAQEPLRVRIASVAALSVPLICGFIVLAVYNKATTHSALETPYQRYTDIYTPKHVYGFHNVVRGGARVGPKVIAAYDNWATNLTPGTAVKNVKARMLASWNWTLAAVPLIGAAIALIGLGWPLTVPWRLLVASIVCLHLAHVPYWYDGIMHWHYVFESAALWLLVFAGGSSRFIRKWSRERRYAMLPWWLGVVAVSLIPQYLTVESLWQSRVKVEIHTTAFSRKKHQSFRATVAAHVHQLPAIVLVKPSPQDLHIDYIINEPRLNADILFGRYRDHCETHVAEHFPERTIYVYDAYTNQWLAKLEPQSRSNRERH